MRVGEKKRVVTSIDRDYFVLMYFLFLVLIIKKNYSVNKIIFIFCIGSYNWVLNFDFVKDKIIHFLFILYIKIHLSQ